MSTPFPPPSGEPVPVPPPVGGPVPPPAPPAPPTPATPVPAAYAAPVAPPSAYSAPAYGYDASGAPLTGPGEPPLGAPSYLDPSVLPASAAAPEPRRGRGKVAVAAVLAVLLVLIGGGAAYGWSVLHRPDVQLARAFSATTSAPQGDVTVEVQGGSSPGSVRYAWGTGTQQIQVRTGSITAADIIVTPNHLTLRIDPSLLAAQPEALAQLHTIATTLGSDGAALGALADGKPVGLAIGPGSPAQKLIDSLKSLSPGTSGSSPSPQVSTDQVAKVAAAFEDAVKKNVTVADAGSDQYGDHYKVTAPLKPIAQATISSVSSELGPFAGKVSDTDLSSLDGKTVTIDVWTQDGRVSRIAVPATAMGGSASDGTLVATFGTGGVQQPTEPVTEISSGLLDKLLGGVGSLGDLGGFGTSGGGATSGSGSIGG